MIDKKIKRTKKNNYYSKGARDSFLEKSRAKNKGFKGAEAPSAEALANDLEDEGNYPVDSATEKHNEDTRKMIIEVIDKVYAEYLEKNKDSIYIYYPKKEDWDWEPLSNDDDW